MAYSNRTTAGPSGFASRRTRVVYPLGIHTFISMLVMYATLKSQRCILCHETQKRGTPAGRVKRYLRGGSATRSGPSDRALGVPTQLRSLLREDEAAYVSLSLRDRRETVGKICGVSIECKPGFGVKKADQERVGPADCETI